jgi:hypothetical protein
VRWNAAALIAGFIALVFANAGFSEPDSDSTLLRAQGAFVAYYAEAATVSVLERKVIRQYAVVAEDVDSQVATRVSIEGSRARLEDLEDGAPILVFWRPDPSDPRRRVAIALEVPQIPKSYLEDFR